MSHYFKNDTLDSKIVKFNDTICGYGFNFTTDKGVFSKNHIDEQTKILLEIVLEDCTANNFLDYGCGYGVVGMTLAKHYKADVDMIDINKRAIELSKINLENNNLSANVFYSDGFELFEKKYEAIILNPPIRAGKKLCYDMYKASKNNLTADGSLYIVIGKKHGAVSTLTYLKQLFRTVDVLYKKKGILVIKSQI